MVRSDSWNRGGGDRDAFGAGASLAVTKCTTASTMRKVWLGVVVMVRGEGKREKRKSEVWKGLVLWITDGIGIGGDRTKWVVAVERAKGRGLNRCDTMGIRGDV